MELRTWREELPSVKMVVSTTGTWMLVVLLVTCQNVEAVEQHSSYASKATSGVYIQDLPSPVFYDTFLPILLEYILPHWNKSDVTFNNWYNCTSETFPYRYTCPSVYHMNKAVMNLHIDFLALQPVTDVAHHSDYYAALLSGSNFCSQIQRHFSGVYIQPDELDMYIRALEKCNTDTLETDAPLILLERTLPDFNFSIRHPFTKMESNFYNIFYKSITGTNTTFDLVASATLSNARATIQGSLLSVYYAEKYRWSHAVQDCSAQAIPHSLITSQNFQDKLDELSKRERFVNNYELAIPLSLISKYYSAPLADCTYTNETFVVRIQIPVKTKQEQQKTDSLPFPHRLLTLTPATFIYDNKICNVQVDSTQRFVYDTVRQVARRTTCNSNELCLKSDTFSSRMIDPCATALINENFEQVLTYCPFKCFYEFGGDLPGEVTSVGKNKFLLIGHGTKSTVSCHVNNGSSPPSTSAADDFDQSHPPMGSPSSTDGNFKVETHELSVLADGALEVTLPCKCTMVVDGKRFFASEAEGCGTDTEVTVTHLTPWHLLKNLDQDGDDMRPDVDLLKFYTADMRKPTDEPATPTKPAPAEASTSQPSESHSTVTLWIFFGMTSLVLLIIQLYIIYILRQSNSNGFSRHTQLLFKARDPEPQAGLLDNQHENL